MTRRDTELIPDLPRTISRFKIIATVNLSLNTLRMPKGRVLKVGFGGEGVGVICLWLEYSEPVDPGDFEERTFVAVLDGTLLSSKWQYVDTAHDQSFSRTWHVYEDVT